MSIGAPKRIRYRKVQKGRIAKTFMETKATTLLRGICGLRVTASGFLTSAQIEAARKAIIRHAKKRDSSSSIWIRVSTDRPITRKPAEVRMGSGKGAVDHWATVVYANQIILEVLSDNLMSSQEALRRGMSKLPLPTSIVSTKTIRKSEVL